MTGAKMERNMGVLGITDITDTTDTAMGLAYRHHGGRLWQACFIMCKGRFN